MTNMQPVDQKRYELLKSYLNGFNCRTTKRITVVNLKTCQGQINHDWIYENAMEMCIFKKKKGVLDRTLKIERYFERGLLVEILFQVIRES